jgi:hypothetical protein
MARNYDPTLRDLYPHLSEEELAEAEDNLERYLKLVLRLFERMEAEADLAADRLSPDPDVIQCLVPGSGTFPQHPPSA